MTKKNSLKYGYYLISLNVFLQVVYPFYSLKSLIFTENKVNKFFVRFSDEPLYCYDWVGGIEQLLLINPIIAIMDHILHISIKKSCFQLYKQIINFMLNLNLNC